MSCFSCFSSKVAPDANESAELITPEQACVVELESLFSAGDRRTLRAVFNWLSVRKVGDPLRSPGDPPSPAPVPQMPSASSRRGSWMSTRNAPTPEADLSRMPPATVKASQKEKNGIVLNKDVVEDYLKLPPLIFDHVWSAFRGSHVSHFHANAHNPLVGPSELDYHHFLHALASFALPEESEQLLFQMLDAFAHSSSCAQEANGGRSVSPSRKSSIMGTLRRGRAASVSANSLDGVPIGGNTTLDNGPQVILMKELLRRRTADPNLGNRVAMTLGRKKKLHSIQQRMASIKAGSFVVVLSEKMVPQADGDEAASITHGELCRILTAVSTVRMYKFSLVNKAYGKVPANGPPVNPTGGSLLTPDYVAHPHSPQTEGAGLDLSALQTSFLREEVMGIVDQIFRFVRYSPDMNVRAPADFNSNDTITLSQLRQWVSVQAPALAEGFAIFLQDNFMTLFAVPDADIRTLGGSESFDPHASMTRIARVSRNMCLEPILPVLMSNDGRPTVVTPFVAWQLSMFIPESASKKAMKYSSAVQASWKLLYSGNSHGFSLQMFRDHVFRANMPTVVLITGQPKKGKVVGTPSSERITIGAFVPTNWEEVKNSYFGNEEAFIFELHPHFEVLQTTMQNNMYAHFGPHGVAFGGGASIDKQKEARIFLDETMQSGVYQQHPVQVNVPPTYRFSRTRNIVMSTGHRSEDFFVPFEVIDLEVYGITGMEPLAVKDEPAPGRRRSSMRVPGGDAEPTTADADYLQFMKEMEDTLAGNGNGVGGGN
ncbi:Restriction of telomere capping protein 5 [Gonapodya sp. JEL0774]|nr:Restriction of telomere capping protein 5 [Gonapodya sp. JEL0774]